MVKLKNNYHHCSSTRIRNVTSLLTSSSFKRWIILLFLLYKLDYKDYYCYGISSVSIGNSAASNNENGKNLTFDLFLFIYFIRPPKQFHLRVHPRVVTRGKEEREKSMEKKSAHMWMSGAQLSRFD